jgi:hypothetical protein
MAMKKMNSDIIARSALLVMSTLGEDPAMATAHRTTILFDTAKNASLHSGEA